jgi:N-acetyltransferase
MNLQPTLQNTLVRIEPLAQEHRESLFEVASDRKIWEQHPNPNRYLRADFETYFEGALASRGAFLVCHPESGRIMGCTRFYDLNLDASVVLIGYTFLAREYWGRKINPALKELLLDYAFGHVNLVRFQVGAQNRRSQIAMERLGAQKARQLEVSYFGEAPKLNWEYEIRKADWQGRQKQPAVAPH